MTTALIILASLIVINAIDVILYINTVIKYGPQYNIWPLSGFYVALFPKKNNK